MAVRLKTFTYRSAAISYRITGKGRPLVLIHGFGEDGNIWQKQVEVLKDHFQLIVPDLPGSGKSEMIEDMSIDGMAEVIKAILEMVTKKEAMVIGHSMGGYITLALAEKYPRLFSSIGLVHSTAFADSEEKKLNRLKSIEFIKNNGAYEFLKTAIPGLFGGSWSKDHQEEISALVEEGKNFTDEAIIQYYYAMINRPDRTLVLKNFSKPVMFIMGEHDTVVPFKQSLQQSYMPSRSYIQVLRRSAHMGMWEEPVEMSNALLQLK